LFLLVLNNRDPVRQVGSAASENDNHVLALVNVG
jgi:hypothetical protein